MIAVKLSCDDYLNQSTRAKHRGRSSDLSSMVVPIILHIDLQVSENVCYTEYGTVESCANAPLT
jgi:hypothetical protein